MRKRKPQPPKLGMALLNFFLDYEDYREVSGDFAEFFYEKTEEKSTLHAYVWFWIQVIFSLPNFIYNSVYWSSIMIKNYLTVALRTIIRQKGYSFINITGLALGMACTLIITLWVLNELSWDRFNENSDNIYRIEQDQDYSGKIFHVNVTPRPMGPATVEEIPEVIAATRYEFRGGMLFEHNDKSFFEFSIRAVDPDFLSIFTFPLVRGEKSTALNDPYSIIVTREIAEKYFGNDEPVGKVLTVNNDYNFTVTGVIEEVPDNSSMQFDILIPYEFLVINDMVTLNWGWNSIVTMVQLAEGSDISAVNEKLTALVRKHRDEAATPEQLADPERGDPTPFSLQNLKDLHLYAYFGFSKSGMAIQYVYIFSIVALFVLFIACINFMNLATAKSSKRAKEIGLRKVVGALRGSLIKQFFGESILYAVISLLFALLLVALFLPTFNNLAGKELTLDILGNPALIWSIVAITLITGLVAGSYPALFLSGFKPAAVIKGGVTSGTKGARFRKILVIFQFTLSIFLIIGTWIILNQLEFMQNKKLGFDKDHLMYINMRGDSRTSYRSFKAALKENPRILNVSGGNNLPSMIGSNSGGANWEGKDPELDILISMTDVDYDYFETAKIEMLAGRTYTAEYLSDTATGFIINEELANIMGGDVIGSRFEFGIEGTIVGVTKNFHFQSARTKIPPLAIRLSAANPPIAMIRLQPENVMETVEFIKSTWETVIPNYPFDYTFLDEDFESMYRSEERISGLMKYFAIFAIMIACLGLFGLASFTAEQRTKEIGIRKALGASSAGVVGLLCKEFVKLVVIANIIAWPLTYFAMKTWQENYAYKYEFGIYLFIIAGLMALSISLVTVSFQAVKAAMSNPVDALQHE